jgi:hypothetical protein
MVKTTRAFNVLCTPSSVLECNKKNEEHKRRKVKE